MNNNLTVFRETTARCQFTWHDVAAEIEYIFRLIGIITVHDMVILFNTLTTYDVIPALEQRQLLPVER